MTMTTDVVVGDILRAWRRHRNHSWVDVARLLGGPWTAIDVSRFERCANTTGEYPGAYPPTEYLEAFGAAYGVDLSRYAPTPPRVGPGDVAAIFAERFPDGACVLSLPEEE